MPPPTPRRSPRRRSRPSPAEQAAALAGDRGTASRRRRGQRDRGDEAAEAAASTSGQRHFFDGEELRPGPACAVARRHWSRSLVVDAVALAGAVARLVVGDRTVLARERRTADVPGACSLRTHAAALLRAWQRAGGAERPARPGRCCWCCWPSWSAPPPKLPLSLLLALQPGSVAFVDRPSGPRADLPLIADSWSTASAVASVSGALAVVACRRRRTGLRVLR